MFPPVSRSLVLCRRVRENVPRQRGFTLIEVCIVVGIILVLTALALPIYSSAQASGIRTQIDNNLHQQSLAIAAYANDHDQLLPGPSDAAVSCTLTSFQILPVYPGARPIDGYLVPYLTFTGQAGGAYVCNAAVVHQGGASAAYYFRVGVPSKPASGYSGAFGNAANLPPLKTIQIPVVYGMPLSQFVYLQTTDTNDPLVGNTAPIFPLDKLGRHYLFGDGHIELRAYNNPPTNFQSTLKTPYP